MFKKVSQVAEKAATNVARRHFLGRIGQAAGAAAAAFAGLLVHSSPAWAGKRTKMCHELSTLTNCQGVPYGSPCGEEGRCWGPKISPGVYNCNECKTKGKKEDDGRG